jgi:NiFe hydrogenase small subunit HydA
VGEALGIKPVNISGCPPNAVNIVATIVHFLLLGKLPALDDYGRPLFAYGKTIHDQCPRRAHYEAGEFVKKFGDEGAMKGWCLAEMGCKGPATNNNCSLIMFNDGTNWPIGAGHPCIGCSEPKFWDEKAPFYEPI